ncbi:uncharacterized protein LOC142231689 [Haematobia irritans]|uniref:uncharacterized protein LOC142231689 n=1 Tax=Haematobia irritans TaxID=7368 RepID=UPI003F50CDB0
MVLPINVSATKSLVQKRSHRSQRKELFVFLSFSKCNQNSYTTVQIHSLTEMHFTLTLLLIFGSFPLLLMKKTYENHQEDYDTPSPEWIKYQQERHDPKYNQRSAITRSDPKLKNNINKQSARESSNERINSNFSTKKKTTSRKNDDKHDSDRLHEKGENRQHQYEDDNNDDNENGGLKYPSIQGFLAFIKSLQHTWIKKSLFRIEDKIKFLYNLKDKLMRTIEQKFSMLWLDNNRDDYSIHDEDVEHRSIKRRKRGILDESGIDFPPETALMSINFLTFAVFLIKLVLQVVNIIRSKHVTFTSMGVNTEAIANG